MIKKKIVCVAVLLFAVFCCTTKPLSAKTRYIQLNQWHKVASLNNVKKIHYNKKKLKISKSRIKANSCGTYIISGKKKKKNINCAFLCFLITKKQEMLIGETKQNTKTQITSIYPIICL